MNVRCSDLKKIQKNKKKGVVSFEMIFGSVFIIFVFMLCVGMFVYIYPRQALEKEVNLLAQEAKVNGGLTSTQISEFKSTMNDMGYDATINVYTVQSDGTTRQALNVAPKNTPYAECMNYTAFVRRDSGQKIIVEVVIGSNDSLVKGPLKWFSSKMLPDNYTITQTVKSERNRC